MPSLTEHDILIAPQSRKLNSMTAPATTEHTTAPPARSLRSSARAHGAVRVRDVGAVLLLRQRRAGRPLHGEIPVRSGADRDRGGHRRGAERRSNSLFGRLDPQPFASQLFGFYTGLAYFMPIVGGLVADRWLGQRRTVIIGGVLMAIGHFLMAFEALFLLALTVPHSRHRRVQAEYLDAGRRALRARRQPARPRLCDLLCRHQYRRVPGAARLRHAGRRVRLALRLRRRGRRHADQPRHLSRRAAHAAGGPTLAQAGARAAGESRSTRMSAATCVALFAIAAR